MNMPPPAMPPDAGLPPPGQWSGQAAPGPHFLPPGAPAVELPPDPDLLRLLENVRLAAAVIRRTIDAQTYRVEILGRELTLKIPADLSAGDRVEIRADDDGRLVLRRLPPAPEAPRADLSALLPDLKLPEKIQSLLQHEGLQRDPGAVAAATALYRYGAPVEAATIRALLELAAHASILPPFVSGKEGDPGVPAGNSAPIAEEGTSPAFAPFSPPVTAGHPGDIPAEPTLGAPISPRSALLETGAFLISRGIEPTPLLVTSVARLLGPDPGLAPAVEILLRRLGARLQSEASRTPLPELPPAATAPPAPPADGRTPLLAIEVGHISPDPVPALTPSDRPPPGAGPSVAPSEPAAQDPATAVRDFASAFFELLQSNATGPEIRAGALALFDREENALPPFIVRSLRRELEPADRPISAHRLFMPLRDLLLTLRSRGGLTPSAVPVADEADRILDRLFIEGGRLFRRTAVPAAFTPPASRGVPVLEGRISAGMPVPAPAIGETAAVPNSADGSVLFVAPSPADALPTALPSPPASAAESPPPPAELVPALRDLIANLVFPLRAEPAPEELSRAVNGLLQADLVRLAPSLTDGLRRVLDAAPALRWLDRLIDDVEQLLSSPPAAEAKTHPPRRSSADALESLLGRIREVLGETSEEKDGGAAAEIQERLRKLDPGGLRILRARLLTLERDAVRDATGLRATYEQGGFRDLAERAAPYRLVNQAAALHREEAVIMDLPIAVDGRVQSVPVRVIRRRGDGESGKRGASAGTTDVRLDLTLTGLGRVVAQLRLQGRRLDVGFHVRDDGVRRLLQSHAAELAEGLKARGLEASVAVGIRTSGDDADAFPLEPFRIDRGGLDMRA